MRAILSQSCARTRASQSGKQAGEGAWSTHPAEATFGGALASGHARVGRAAVSAGESCGRGCEGARWEKHEDLAGLPGTLLGCALLCVLIGHIP